MAKNYGEDLYGNESDACSFWRGQTPRRCDPVEFVQGLQLFAANVLRKDTRCSYENDVLHDEAASRRKETKEYFVRNSRYLLKPNRNQGSFWIST